MILLRRINLIIALLCCVALCFGAIAASPSTTKLGLDQLKQSESVKNAPATNQSAEEAVKTQLTQENFTLLKQDSGTNLSVMNLTFTTSPTLGSAQAVKFTAPKAGWKLKLVIAVATDGWNASRNELPNAMPFTIEIRDANLGLLYHFADIQYPYFTTEMGFRSAVIEMPAIPLEGDFYVCFYGYRSIGLATELQNATGNSYLFDKITGSLYPGVLTLENNQTLPVNWLIRAVGE